MSVNSVGVSKTDYNSAYAGTATKKTEDTVVKTNEEQAAVYEKSSETSKSDSLYKVNKMSSEDRKALVAQLQADLESRKQNLVNIVQNMMGKQAKTFTVANDEDAMWKFLASGDYTVDAATKEQAQKDISEDGYWGVKETSKRLFDFASALAGDDVDKMKKMQDAMMEGYKQAVGAWGRDLPSICSDTIDAANKLFDDYYASKQQ